MLVTKRVNVGTHGLEAGVSVGDALGSDGLLGVGQKPYLLSGAPIYRHLPGLVRVKPCHRLGGLGSVLPKVLLVNNSVHVHNKRHDSGIAVFCRVSHQRKTADHLAICNVIVCTSGGVLSLCLQDFVVISVIRKGRA